jgi:hypothetical protein
VSCPSRSSLATSLRCFATRLSSEATRASACSKCCSNTSRSIGLAATLSCRPWAGTAVAAGRPAEFAQPLPAEEDRPSPPPSAASPPLTAAERREWVRPERCVRRPGRLAHDADIPLPAYSSQRRPRSTFKKRRHHPAASATGKWPREERPGGARLRVVIQCSGRVRAPRARIQLASVKSVPPRELFLDSRRPYSGSHTRPPPPSHHPAQIHQ